jgi:hypothetical protein
MSYDIIETSSYDGAPIELWEFTLGSQVYRMTSRDVDYTTPGGTVYSAAAMTSPDYVRSLDMDDSAIELKIDKSSPLAVTLLAVAMSIPCTYTASRKHTADVEVVDTAYGDVTGYDIQGGWMALRLDSLLARTAGTGLRRFYSVGCGHQLYGPYCKLVKEDFLTIGAVTVVAGNQITIPALTGATDGDYEGGFLSWYNSAVAGTERAWVTKHEAGGVLTLAWRPDSMVVGVSASVYEGCDRRKVTCTAKGNDINYGGFAYMPDKNPFGGTTVF